MGSNSYDTTSSSTPTPAVKVNKYPHIPITNGSVKLYLVADGKNGDQFIPQFSAKMNGDKFVVSNSSFISSDDADNEIAIDDKLFTSKYGPMVLTTSVYLSLDDYRTNKSVPLGDIRGALAQ